MAFSSLFYRVRRLVRGYSTEGPTPYFFVACGDLVTVITVAEAAVSVN